jgi:hypothetical protein
VSGGGDFVTEEDINCKIEINVLKGKKKDSQVRFMKEERQGGGSDSKTLQIRKSGEKERNQHQTRNR